MAVKFTVSENGVLKKAELVDQSGFTLNHGVRGIRDEDFDISIITDAVIPDGVTHIGDGAFAGCDWLSGVVIPESVTNIGNRAFYDCYSLAAITIPAGVTSIGVDLFADCNNLESVSILGKITCIGERVFAWCESLTNVIIPESVTSIDEKTFYGCGAGLIIRAPAGSYAERYALKNGIKFEAFNI